MSLPHACQEISATERLVDAKDKSSHFSVTKLSFALHSCWLTVMLREPIKDTEVINVVNSKVKSGSEVCSKGHRSHTGGRETVTKIALRDTSCIITRTQFIW